jgi:hypothetical protein
MTNLPPSQPPTPPHEGWLSWLNAVKGLTITNVLVIGMLAVIAVPAYLVYKAVNDATILDRFMSHYHEVSSQQMGCTIREARLRGGSEMWFISSGFAFQGADRWAISVILDHEPDKSEVMSYCESLKLIADKMLDRSHDRDNAADDKQ